MNELKMKFKIFNDVFPDYKELFNFFLSHNYTHFSISKFNEYMKLLFDNNPFGNGIQVIARDNSGEIIGYIGLLSVPFSYNDISFSGGQIVNILVHSRFRGKGVFLKLLDCLLKDTDKSNYEFIFGFPNPISYNGFKKKEWDDKELSYWKTKLADTSEFSTVYKYKSIKNFEKIDLPNIAQAKYSNELFQINKNLEYLTWRFIELGNFFQYEIFEILDDSENCLGFLVLNEYKEKQITYGQILDAVIPFNNYDIYNDLLNFYCNYYKEKRIFDLQFFLYSPLNIKNLLISRNFSSYSKNRFFIYQSQNQGLLNAIKFNKFFLFLSSKDNV